VISLGSVSGSEKVAREEFMNYGEVFATLLAQAIECEEAELRQLSAEYRDSKQTDTSIRKYYEPWVSVALLKQVFGADALS
jgi:hypothetical protein